MRILASTPLYPPGSRVGAWLTTHEFLAHMVALGHEVDVVTILGIDRDELDGVQVWPKHTSLAEMAQGADLCVSHLGDDDRLAQVAAAAGIPSVRMIHGSSPADRERLDAIPTALAVFVSDAVRESNGWDGPSVVAHPPIDLTRHDVTPGGCVTLVNLTEAKGVGRFYALAESRPDLAFLGCMGGYGRQDVRDLPNVEIITPTRDVPGDVWARTRVLLMPSRSETWGRVALEAAAAGIPVLAAPVSGVVECMGDAATYAPDSHVGWVEALDGLLARWDDASAKARARAATFDRQAQLDTFAAAVEQLMVAA